MGSSGQVRAWRYLLLAGGVLAFAPAQAQDLPGARPGSTLRLTIPARDDSVRGATPDANVKAALPKVEPVQAEAPKLQAPGPAATGVAVAVPPAAPAEGKPAAPQPEAAPIVAAQGEVDEAKIRAFLEPLKTKYRLKPEEIAGFMAAYAARGGKPAFVEETNGAWVVSARFAGVLRAIENAAAEGLEPARLKAVLPGQREGAVATDKRVETELAAAFSAFLYARDARGGRLEPARLSALTTPTLYLPSLGEVFEAALAAPEGGVQAALERFNPQHAGYRRLRSELAKLNQPTEPVFTGNVAGGAGAPQPEGQLKPGALAGGPLRLGQADPRVSLLRVRLNLPPGTGNVFDAELRGALIAFQRANNLTANGQLTPRTREALENGANPVNLAAARSDKRTLRNALLVNMERWRWLPPELGSRHVFVNIPAFELKVVEGEAITHRARVIVGKPETQTPVFSDQFAHVIVNPSWFVPPSIMKKEFLPRLASDPSYAARRGFQVVHSKHGISVRQPPGERNALGHVKFIFPNRHSVYLHDTPSRGLFASETRAFSHGCVRVDKPMALAEKLLTQSGGFSEAQLKGMVGRGERMIKMADKVGVHLAYFTLEADEGGSLHHHRDLYGHDSRLRAALML